MGTSLEVKKPSAVEQLVQAQTIISGVAMTTTDGLRQGTVMASALLLRCIDIEEGVPLKTQHND